MRGILIALAAAALVLGGAAGARAERYMSGTIVTTEGAVTAKAIPLSDADRGLRVTVAPTGTVAWVPYDRIARIVVAGTVDDTATFRGALILTDGRRFEVRSDFFALFKTLRVPVAAPVGEAQGYRTIAPDTIREVDLTDGGTGRYRVAPDGRIFPGAYVYDPRTGEELELVEDPAAAAATR